MLHRSTLLAAVTALGLAASTQPAAAKCARSTLQATVLTQAPIAPGGGILIAAESSPDQASPEIEHGAVQPTWKLKTGGSSSAPKIDELAPGLAVYRLPAAATKAELLADRRVVAKVTVSRTPVAELAAPKVKTIVHERHAMGRRVSVRTTVTLDGAAPADAVALVLTDAHGTARSFGRVTPGALTVEVYAHGGCDVLPDGMIESTGSDQVAVFWVDQSGRRSPATRPQPLGLVK